MKKKNNKFFERLKIKKKKPNSEFDAQAEIIGREKT